ncbi:MAG: hypothetical protein WCC99_04310 [Candidatus Sulfotelmatobacter sp.]
MTGYSGYNVKTIPPARREPIKPRGRPKLDLRPVEHVCFGLGRVLAIRQIDGSDDGYMADVKFADGTTRTLLLIQRVWLTDIAPLIPDSRLKLRRAAKVKQVVENDAGATNEDGDTQGLDIAA